MSGQPAVLPDEDEISLLAVGAIVLRGRRVLVAAVLVGGVFGAAGGLRTRPTFEASASFMAQAATASSGGLASLAGQFGIRVPGSDGGASPEFYQELLTSREVLSAVLSRSYAVGQIDAGASAVPLLDLLEIEGRSEAERVETGLDWAKRRISSSVGRQTGVVSFTVTTSWPELSRDLASTLLDDMQGFNLRTRRTQAQAERVFLESRVVATQAELRDAEGALLIFLQQNRQFQNSPELQFQAERLQRDVTMRQEVYSGLVQAYEEAKIREVRDTPAITVLEHPVLPARREARGTVLKALLGLILGGFLGLGWILTHQAVSKELTSDGMEFRAAWAETKADLRRLTPKRGRS